MKVAQLLTGSTGGIGRHVASIAPRLEQRGHQVRVFCPEATAEAQGFSKLGIDVWPLSSPRRFIGADLVHAHGLKAGWLGLPIAWMYKGSRRQQRARHFERWRWEPISLWEQAAISWPWQRAWALGTCGSPPLPHQFYRSPRRVEKSSAWSSVPHPMTR